MNGYVPTMIREMIEMDYGRDEILNRIILAMANGGKPVTREQAQNVLTNFVVQRMQGR